MNPTPTREELDDFIALYNKRMKWNADIRSHVKESFVNENEDIKEILDYWFPTELLSEEDTDDSNVDVIDNSFCPELYETVNDDGRVLHELHTYSITYSHHQYYFLTVNESEKEYKAKMTKKFLEYIINIIVSNDRQKEKIMEENTRLYRLKNMIEPQLSNQ